MPRIVSSRPALQVVRPEHPQPEHNSSDMLGWWVVAQTPSESEPLRAHVTAIFVHLTMSVTNSRRSVRTITNKVCSCTGWQAHNKCWHVTELVARNMFEAEEVARGE